ncbi:MAG: S-layer family protein [Candidatus Magnetomorum sp.]|nr:S-layer family protein [Candidatus Magnetomorum sp.]
MPVKQIIFCIVCLFLLKVELQALDYSSQNNVHPHGIIPDVPETIVNTDASTFTISGGVQNQTTVFHKFKQFNIHQGESAIFQDAGFDHTVAQVTGANYSWINGLLKSEAQQFYLINANGIMVGADAYLDVAGSFYASTADDIHFSDHLGFDGSANDTSKLTVAPLVSFGFLSDNLSTIAIQGIADQTGEKNSSRPGLYVSENKTLSLIAGDILINDHAKIQASSGSIQLISVASTGSVHVFENNIPTLDVDVLGDITISDHSILDTSGSAGGDIFIRSGKLIVDNSQVLGITRGINNGGNIDIRVNNLLFTNGAYIDSSTNDIGNAGNIDIVSNTDIVFDGENEDFQKSGIFLRSTSDQPDAGNAGSVLINAVNVSFLNGAAIDSATIGTGNGGEIEIIAKENIFFKGKTFHGDGSHLEVASLLITGGAGDAGSIALEGKNIYFEGSVYINSTTDGQGKSGNISIKAYEKFSFLGEKNTIEKSSIIIAGTWYEGSNGGQGGNVSISAKYLDFKNYVIINTATAGEGQGGRINIDVAETASFDNQCTIQVVTSSKRELAGDGGTLNLKAKNIAVKNGSTINSTTYGRGTAGYIQLETTNMLQVTGNESLTSAITGEVSLDSNGGNGDSINIKASNISLIDEAIITTTSSSIGNAGDIMIQTSALNLYGQSAIASKTLNAIGGNAGNINIQTQTLCLLGSDALISTSSNGSGNGGSILVNAEKIDLKFGQITSESLYDPNTQFESFEQFQQSALKTGDIVSFPDGGRQTRYFVFNNQLVPMTNFFYIVDHIQDLDELIIQNKLFTGEIAWVKNQNNGTMTQYIYMQTYRGMSWTPITESSQTIEINDANYLSHLAGEYETPPLPNGTMISFLDSGEKKNGLYIYCYADVNYNTNIYAEPVRINQFDISTIENLSELKTQKFLENQALAMIKNDAGTIESTYVLHSDEWIQVNAIRHFENQRDTIQHLSQIGDIASIHSGNHQQIYLGDGWMDIKTIYSVTDRGELSLLNAQTGDIGKCITVEDKTPQTYVFIDNQWVPFFQSGSAGIIDIQGHQVQMDQNSSVSTSTNGNGEAGNILLSADTIVLNHASKITSESHANFSGGPAGSVHISDANQSGTLKILNSSSILTDSTSSGGGKISIQTNDMIVLNSDITTNVKDGFGNGGDMNITTEQLALNRSKVTANAIDGDGGAIYLFSNHFIQSADTIIEASSKRGNEGTVEIDAPDMDMDSQVIQLPSDFLNASRWLRASCQLRDSRQSSHLIVQRHPHLPSFMVDYCHSPPGLD